MNQRLNAVGIAQSETGRNPGGNKFWSHMGYKQHVEWCACFISWLMDQVDLPADKWKRSGGCTQMLTHARKLGIILDKDTAPEPGDIVFFEWSDPLDGPDHAGIISLVNDDDIYTIEGNVKDTSGIDNVVCRCWSRTDTKIYAIARPAYDTGSDWTDLQEALARIVAALLDIMQMEDI